MPACTQVTPLVGAIIALSTAIAAIAGGMSAQSDSTPAAEIVETEVAQ